MMFSDFARRVDGRWKPLPVLLVVLLAVPCGVLAEEFSQRDSYGALLEPIGKTIHGAGPTPSDFANYWNLMGQNNKPMVYMNYVGLKDAQTNWAARWKAEMLKYQPMFVIPQIGLSMTQDGYPDQHYEDEVATGSLDYAIHAFLDQLEELALPVYLRIGYEFNGSSWNGYEPGTYIQAFTHIRTGKNEIPRPFRIRRSTGNPTASLMCSYPSMCDCWHQRTGLTSFSDQARAKRACQTCASDLRLVFG
jgi:hypothetical protein